ncbi:MAG: hypothetical protein ACW97O_01365 [Candidatus Thorarchaeota archaeon]
MAEDLEQITQQNKVVIRNLMKAYRRGQMEVIAIRNPLGCQCVANCRVMNPNMHYSHISER